MFWVIYLFPLALMPKNNVYSTEDDTARTENSYHPPNICAEGKSRPRVV